MNYDHLPELAAYLRQPRAMPVGTPGKHGVLRMEFEQDARGKCILRHLDRRAPLIVQQALYFDEAWPSLPCVYILSSGGPNVDGDRYEQYIRLKRGAYAHISTGAATKLAEMRSNYSALTQHFYLDEDAYLEYLPEPTIPCRHTRFVSDTRLTVHPTATLFYSEIFTSGRKHYAAGERFHYDLLSVTTRGERPEGAPLFREKFIVAPAHSAPQTLGCMAGYDVFANVVVMTPPPQADAIYHATPVCMKPDADVAAGITRLPGNAGLLYKVLGRETEPVKRRVRDFCSCVRQQVKGLPLPPEFPWR
ncbi:MAG: urease accessory protein UreD [Bacteroides sp.]|nr:urease accessory protein UreD [Bacteroides sp.]